MGCNNANPRKCANCYRGGNDPAAGTPLDAAPATWYNGKEISKAAQGRKNALGHKAYSRKKATQWLGLPTG